MLITGDKALIKEFLEWYRSLGRDEETVATARRHLEAFSQWLSGSGKSLEDFNHRDVMRYFAWMRSVGYDEDTMVCCAIALKKFLSYMCEFVGREDMYEVYRRVRVPERKRAPPEALDPGVIRDFIFHRSVV